MVIGGRGTALRLFFSLFVGAIGMLGTQAIGKADSIADLRSLSVFKDADLGKLANGDVLASKGPAMGFARGLSVESAYIVRAPVKTTLALQERWNPTRHPELKVYAQADISGRGNPGDFQGLASVRSNSSVKAFVDATLRLPGGASKLQLSGAEAKMFSPGGSSQGAIPASVVAFWSKVLAERAQSFASGGLGGQAPYDTSGSPVRADQEVSQLIRETGNVQSYFSSLISSTPIGGGRGHLRLHNPGRCSTPMG